MIEVKIFIGEDKIDVEKNKDFSVLDLYFLFKDAQQILVSEIQKLNSNKNITPILPKNIRDN